LHMAQLMPLPLTVSCFSKIQIGFTFLVPAHPGSPGQRAVKRMCVCVWLLTIGLFSATNFVLVGNRIYINVVYSQKLLGHGTGETMSPVCLCS